MTLSSEGAATPLRTPTLRELLATPMKPREHLMEPWFRQGESVMLWAATGVGKTMLSLSLAVAIAGGGELFGWRAPRPRRVLLIDGEMHVADLTERLRMIGESLEGDWGAALENIRVLSRQDQEPDAPFPDLGEDAGRDAVLAMARGFDLVILDNFSTLATVDDENAAGAMNPVLGFLMRLKQAGIACLLVHHSNKSGMAFRGSSKLATTFEVIIGLLKDDARAREGAAFTLSWEKYRGTPDDRVRGLKARLVPDGDGRSVWVHEASKHEECARLVAMVRSLEYPTQADLATAFPCSGGHVSGLKGKAIGEFRLITEAEWDRCMTEARAIRDGTSEEADADPF